MPLAQFPILRTRRLRQTEAIRRMTRETILRTQDFIYPLFIRHGKNIRHPIASMPGQFQLSVDEAVKEAETAASLGILSVLLFGIPASKDSSGSENYDPQGIIPQAICAIKERLPEMVVISDLCCCEYTSHGHCGLINTPGDIHFNPQLPESYVLNDATLEILGKAAKIHAQAGADVIAPSAMMDGMVAAIRAALDADGFEHTGILSYAAKYASSFYGPFREAAESPPRFGNRNQYQMDPANRREAIKEVLLDLAEGADMVMVKPALPYLDVLAEVRRQVQVPLAAYQVSGEYAMLHAAAQSGWLDLQRCAMESLIAIKRAGADLMITYFALEAARWLKEENS